MGIMLDAFVWLFASIGAAFTDLVAALAQPGLWLSWMGGLETTEDKQALMRFVYYGGSTEFFFVCFTAFILLTIAGLWRRAIMWRSVRILEGLGDKSGEGTTLNNISQIFKARGDYETALRYLEQSLAISQEIGDKSGEGVKKIKASMNNDFALYKRCVKNQEILIEQRLFSSLTTYLFIGSHV